MQPGTLTDLEICMSTYCNIEIDKDREHPLSENAYYLSGCLWGIRYTLSMILDIDKDEFTDLLQTFKEDCC